MAGNFQDDLREDEMRNKFDLYKNIDQGRSGIDAFLKLDGKIIPFELKTTSTGSVTTVRDFGPDHIEKWKDKHWLIGFFMNGEEHYKYGSPAMMKPWIDSKEKYIAPDFKLASLSASKLTLEDMYQVIGKKNFYTLEDAKILHKKQYTIDAYRSFQDLTSGYSPQRMLDIIKDRTKYIAERGSTLNNPHIPLSYFSELVEIKENHAQQLRNLVGQYIQLGN